MSKKLIFKVLAKEERLYIMASVVDETFDIEDDTIKNWFPMDELYIQQQIQSFINTPYKSVYFVHPNGYDIYNAQSARFAIEWLIERTEIHNGWLIIKDVPFNEKTYHCAKKISELYENYNEKIYLCDKDYDELIKKLS